MKVIFGSYIEAVIDPHTDNGGAVRIILIDPIGQSLLLRLLSGPQPSSNGRSSVCGVCLELTHTPHTHDSQVGLALVTDPQ